MRSLFSSSNVTRMEFSVLDGYRGGNLTKVSSLRWTEDLQPWGVHVDDRIGILGVGRELNIVMCIPLDP